MRLLLLNGNTDPAITALMMDRAAEALPRLGLAGVTLDPATARFGARYIASRAAAAIAGHAVLDAVAEQVGPDNPAGYGAVLLACFGDPGLEAAKELCPVPVVGMAEASLAVALRMAEGRPVALLTGGAAWVPMLEAFALVHGHERDRVRVHAVSIRGDRIARDPETALAPLADAGRAAVADGAAVVVLGGAGLAGLAGRLAPRVPGAAVLDSLDCLLAEGTAAVGASRAGRERPGAVETQGLSPALAAALGGTEGPGA